MTACEFQTSAGICRHSEGPLTCGPGCPIGKVPAVPAPGTDSAADANVIRMPVPPRRQGLAWDVVA